jgi:hypothetical protein
VCPKSDLLVKPVPHAGLKRPKISASERIDEFRDVGGVKDRISQRDPSGEPLAGLPGRNREIRDDEHHLPSPRGCQSPDAASISFRHADREPSPQGGGQVVGMSFQGEAQLQERLSGQGAFHEPVGRQQTGGDGRRA